MTITQRRLLYSSFILLFVLLCPLVLLYGSGYRFDVRHRRIFRIGLLALDVTPSPDVLHIDGRLRPLAGGATLRVGGLPPGQHRVRLEKQGYLTWEQDIVIVSGKATTLEGIRLFRAEIPLVVSRDVAAVVPAPNGTRLAVTHTVPPSLTLAATGERPDETVVMNEAPRAAHWSPDGKELLVMQGNGTATLWHAATDKQELLPDANAVLTDAAWHPKDANTLYLLRNTALLRWDRDARSVTPLINRVRAFQPTEQDVLLVQTVGNKDQLVVLDRDGTTTTLTSLPADANWQFLPGPAELITLLDRTHGQLLLVRRAAPTVMQTFSNVQQAVWSSNGRLLFLQNGFELLRFDRSKAQRSEDAALLLRSGTPIIAVWPLGTSSRFLLLQQQTGLRLLDTAEGAPQEPYTLFHGPLQAVAQADALVYLVTEKGLLVRLAL